MTNRTLGFSLAALIFAADQAMKGYVTHLLNLIPLRQIEITGIFNLTWVENRGVSLGLLTADSDSQRWLLVALTVVIATGVTVWLWRETNRHDAIGLGLVLGGALGNILDRSRLGYVVDYADLHFGDWRPFLVFNLGDAAITVGVLILLAQAFLARDTRKVDAHD